MVPGTPLRRKSTLTSVGHVDNSCNMDDGELCMRGTPSCWLYKDPEATAEVIDKDGWFHTGDIRPAGRTAICT